MTFAPACLHTAGLMKFISPKPGATRPHSRTVGGDRVHSESPV